MKDNLERLIDILEKELKVINNELENAYSLKKHQEISYLTGYIQGMFSSIHILKSNYLLLLKEE
jgi:hypothetical protein